MRILHLKNIANYAWRLAQAQKALGHDAVVWGAKGPEQDLGFSADDIISFDPIRWNATMLGRWAQIREFDVIHVHGGVWKTQILYRLLKNRMVIHYHGRETRTGAGLYHKDIANVHFYTPSDLKKWHPEGIWLPQPIDLPLRPAPPDNKKPVFVHFRTSEINKGTTKVIEMFGKAFGPLRKSVTSSDGKMTRYSGYGADLWVWERISHADVLDLMKRADVVFDQIAPFGIYGYISVEAMALGKPAFATINPRLYPRDCPVVFPNVPLLRTFARDAEIRRAVGMQGRLYVERVHAAPMVAQKALDLYAQNL